MTTRGVINSNFYQIVNVDANGAPTEVKPEYIGNVGNANYANYAGNAVFADSANIATRFALALYRRHSPQYQLLQPHSIPSGNPFQNIFSNQHTLNLRGALSNTIVPHIPVHSFNRIT